MSIPDFATEVSLTYPMSGQHTVFSNSYDLTDGSDGFSQLFGGSQLYMQFEVTTAYTADGSPSIQFGVALDDSATLSDSAHVLAMTGGSFIGSGNSALVGYTAAQLTLGKTFHLAIPPWEDTEESNLAAWPHTTTPATETAFRLFHYLGIVAVNPSEDTDSDYFTDGAVSARIVMHSEVGNAVTSNIYPSRMKVL